MRKTKIIRKKTHQSTAKNSAKEYVWNYLSTHPCTSCGESDPHALEFHHVGEKTTEVSRLIGRGNSLETLKAEIAQCVVLCANCHRKLTGKSKAGSGDDRRSWSFPAILGKYFSRIWSMPAPEI